MLVASLIVGVAQCLALGLGDYYGAHDCDVTSLAIEYFDPDHKKGLTAASDEWAFMREALIAAYRKVPETQGIHRRSMGDVTSHTYNALVLYSHDTMGRVRVPRDAFDKIARTIAETGAEYCQIQQTGTAMMFRDCTYYLGDPRDGSSRASVRFLFKYGFMGMRTWEVRDEHWRMIVWGDGRDPYHRLAAMKRDPMYREVFGKYELEVFVPRSLIGDGSSITFESRPRRPDFTSPFTLRFSYGWDCQDGCMGRHDWLVRCRPLGQQSGDWQFDVELVREEGDALPDYERSCLRCGRADGSWSH